MNYRNVLIRFALVVAAAAGLTLAAAGLALGAAEPNAGPQADPAAVARARTTVKMLDDVYKTAIVVFTDKFVTGAGDAPAGAFAVPWFEEVSKTGWHKVRLIDVTGEPLDDKNVARSEFEKAAVARIKAGEGYVEQLATAEGKPVLLAATAVPVVMDKCVLCHPNYQNLRKGQPIGAITYEMPIEVPTE